MAKIEIDVNIEEVIDSMGRNELQETGTLIMRKLAQTPQPTTPEPTVQKIEKQKKYISSVNTNARWTDDERQGLKSRFLLWKGNITDQRYKILMHRFKRTRGSIYSQINLHGDKWLREAQKPKPVVTPNTKPKKKKYKKSAKTEKMYDLARKLSKQDTESHTFGHYIGKASRQMKQGDAHTQQKPPQVVTATGQATFPIIFPLEDKANAVFKVVCRDMINFPDRTFDRDTADELLQLPPQFEWDKSTWERFCQRVVIHSKHICTVLNVKGKFMMSIDNSGTILKYKK